MMNHFAASRLSRFFFFAACALSALTFFPARTLAAEITTAVEESGSATPSESVAESVVEAEAEPDESWVSKGFSMNYTNIVYGPSIEDSSSYQPTSEGKVDTTRPIFMKNFLSASYAFRETWALTGTAYWWHRPVLGQEFTIQDPFVRVSNSSIFSTPWGLNLYSDMRLHPGVTDSSRQLDQIFGVQSFNYLSYQPNYGALLLALRASARYNVHGRQGIGTDVEFYLAPEANYRLSDKFALTLLYEMGASHQFGDDLTYLTNDGTDLEPGIEWNPTPNIIVNPYVTLRTGGKVTLASTSMGMFFTWNFL